MWSWIFVGWLGFFFGRGLILVEVTAGSPVIKTLEQTLEGAEGAGAGEMQAEGTRSWGLWGVCTRNSEGDAEGGRGRERSEVRTALRVGRRT